MASLSCSGQWFAHLYPVAGSLHKRRRLAATGWNSHVRRSRSLQPCIFSSSSITGFALSGLLLGSFLAWNTLVLSWHGVLLGSIAALESVFWGRPSRTLHWIGSCCIRVSSTHVTWIFQILPQCSSALSFPPPHTSAPECHGISRAAKEPQWNGEAKCPSSSQKLVKDLALNSGQSKMNTFFFFYNCKMILWTTLGSSQSLKSGM